MEDYTDVDAMYEERTHIEDDALVGYDEYTTFSEYEEDGE